MSDHYFEPWIGKNFLAHKVLLMSESTYDWTDEQGLITSPMPTHPEESITYNIHNFGKVAYFKQLNRALCAKDSPSIEEMQAAWNEYAYTIFVQEPVGYGAGTRPKSGHWQSAGQSFLSLLEKLRLSKVIVTGKEMWSMMPECAVRLLDDLQAYKLKDGSLVWCLALPHPANRIVGFRWDAVAESIRAFRATEFPKTMNGVV